jgi:ubiquinone/menaquinone biosynthesis C-methylase UbiE
MDKQLVHEIIQWDVQNWAKALKFWGEYLKKSNSKKAAAFGEVNGGLALWLLKNKFHVECSDLNDLKNAKELHEKYNYLNQVNYSKQDITNIKFDENSFDIVVFKSVLGSLSTIELQEKAINELYRILKPGGYLLFAENLKGSFLHQIIRKKFITWGKSWRYPKIKELEKHLREFSHVNQKTYGVISLFGRTEKQRSYLALFDKVFTIVTPKRWRYILFAACKK